MLVVQKIIRVKKDTKKTVATIVKYEFYQGRENEKKTQNRREKDTKETQKHTNNNVNKEIKNKTMFDDFNLSKRDTERAIFLGQKNTVFIEKRSVQRSVQFGQSTNAVIPTAYEFLTS